MNIIEMENLKYKDNISIALGNFDGLHRGHISLIYSMIRDSEELGLKSSVLLFDNHTKSLTKGQAPRLLTDKIQKETLIDSLGVDILYKMDFDQNLRNLSAESFVKDILIKKLNIKAVTVGYNYRFGFGALGNSYVLNAMGEDYGFKVTIIDPVTVEGEIVSSTLIRDYIKKGNMHKANNMLGRKYTLKGQVINGKKLGHKLGYPTANMELSDSFLIPKCGVYASKTKIKDKKYLSVTSIGNNPTFNEKEIKIENHILNFNKNIYGEEIEIEIIERIRDEKKFNNLEELKKQIEKDVNIIRCKYNKR